MAASIEALSTERMRLERLGERHLDDLVRMHLDERVMATLGGVRDAEATRSFAQEWAAQWEKDGFGLWAALDRKTDRFVGRGGLRRTVVGGADEVEVAYGFLTPFWGQGLATELARRSVEVGFDELGLPDLVCFTLTTNLASQRVMAKAGFRFEREVLHKGYPHRLCRLRAGERS